MDQILSYGTILGLDPNIKESYPQIIPKYTHGFCASQAYILRDFQGETHIDIYTKLMIMGFMQGSG
jgi:regulator of sigma D